MIKLKQRYILFFFTILWVLPIVANNPLIRNISKKKYNAANKNWAIREDEKGFLYIANDFGLLVFDGIDWQLHSLPNQQGVKSIYVKDHNLIYTGNFEDFGMWARDPNGVLQYQSLSKDIPKSDLRDIEFWQIYEKNDCVYFQSFQSIYVVDSNKVTKIKNDGQFLFLMKLKNELWVQKMKGSLYKIENDNLVEIPNTSIFTDKDVRAVLSLKNGNILIGTSNDGLYIYDGNACTKWNTQASAIAEKYELNCLLSLDNNNILIGTITNGIYEITPKGVILSNYSINNQLLNNTILGLYKANNGSVWIGMDKGLANIQYIPNISYYCFDKQDIGTVYDAKFWNDYLFICTNQGVYSLLKQELMQTQALSNFKMVDGTQGQAWSLSVIDGNLYCAHNRGIKQIISPTKAIDKKQNSNYNEKGVYSIEEARIQGKDVWLISTYNNLQIVDSDGKQILLDDNKYPVKNALVDHMNNIWVKVPYKGIRKYRLDSKFKLIEDTLLFDNNLGISFNQNLNMFKFGERVVISKGHSFYTYDEISGQLSENKILNDNFKLSKNIENIKKIKDDYYWIITSSSVHLIYYNGSEVKCLYQYALDTYDLSLVDKNENIAVLNDSLSLICLDNGFLIHDRSKASNIKKIQPPSIEYVCGRSSSNISDITNFPISNNIVKVTPNGGDLLEIQIHNPQVFYDNEYIQYRLVGVEDEWSQPLKTNMISFSRLPQGKYEFQIRSVGRLGEISEQYHIILQVEPPFYKSNIAFFIYVLLFFTIAYFLWLFYIKRLKKIRLQKMKTIEQLKLRQHNIRLEDEIVKVNSELFTRSNLILQKNKIFREIQEIVNNSYKKKSIKDIDQLCQSLSKILDTEVEDKNNWEMILISFEQKHPNFYNNLKKMEQI